jgi:hypothetical protein
MSLVSFMLSVPYKLFMLNVIMQNGIMLSVVGPKSDINEGNKIEQTNTRKMTEISFIFH